MKKIILLLIAILAPLSGRADEKKSAWIGALVGKQSSTSGGTIEPLSYGGTLGFKGESIGFGLSYITGSETTTIKGISIDQSSTLITGQLDWFPGGGHIFYVGPAVAYTKLAVGATVAGKAVTLSTSGPLFGGGLGFNIPMGSMSIGIDGQYVTGTLDNSSASVASVLLGLKLWL